MIGHWPWRYDPDIYARIMVSKSPHTVAILRDPAKRALSSYFYNHKRLSGDTSRASIKDFADFLEYDYDEDFYCRWFCYPASPDHPDYDNAKTNLMKNISTVGIVEEYQKFLDICNYRFELNSKNTIINKGDKHFGVSDLPDNVRVLLYKKTEKDRYLYDIAKARFFNDYQNYLDS